MEASEDIAYGISEDVIANNCLLQEIDTDLKAQLSAMNKWYLIQESKMNWTSMYYEHAYIQRPKEYTAVNIIDNEIVPKLFEIPNAIDSNESHLIGCFLHPRKYLI